MATPLPVDYSERTASVSPATAGFGRGGGKANYPMYYSSLVLHNAIRDLLGHVARTPGSGRLTRVMPATHPLFPWMTATRIATIRGKGQFELLGAYPSTEGTQLAAYAQYPLWELDCEFEHLPFACLPDAAVGVRDLSWAIGDPDNSFVTQKIANEYIRFVSWETQPTQSFVTAQYGQQKFRTRGGPPNGITFPGAPRIALGGATIKVTWHFVPYSLMEDANSPIIKYLGRINQGDFSLGTKTYPEGSLLYESVAATRYMPPAPDYTVQRTATAFSHDYVADITFTFQYVDRTPADTAFVSQANPGAGAPPTPNNGNWLAKGWNLRPWVQDGKFYYVTAAGITDVEPLFAAGRPSYLSFPFEFLFSDPAQT